MNFEFNELRCLLNEYGPVICTGDNFSSAEFAKPEKIKNAIKAYAEDVDINNVLGICDFTVFGSGKEGILFTTAGVYVKEVLTKPFSFKYAEIEKIEHTLKGKKDCDGKLTVELSGGYSLTIGSLFANKSPLKEFLEKAKSLSEQGMVAENDHFLIIEDMSDEIKYAYVSCVATFADLDDEISPAELNRLYLLMSRIKTGQAVRQRVMNTVHEEKVVSEYIDILKVQIPQSSMKAVAISLIKDIIIIAGVSYTNFDEKQTHFMNNIMNNFIINDNEVQLIQESIDLERKFLRGEIDEKKFVKSMQTLGANAAAIGFPIAAVYLSGSVVGLSAAGITSGLASLGLGGVLGLSSMVTGVGVVVLIAVAAHSGVKWVANRGKDEKIKNKRELLIAEAMRMNQDTISALVEDIGFLSKELEVCMADLLENKERVLRISKRLKKYSEAATTKNQSSTGNELLCINN